MTDEPIDISRQTNELCAKLGFPPDLVALLQIRPLTLTATIYRTNAEGKHHLDENDEPGAKRTFQVTIHTSGPIKPPNTLHVGDEIRITGNIRVVAMAEDLIDAASSNDSTEHTLTGDVSYTLLLSDVAPAHPA